MKKRTSRTNAVSIIHRRYVKSSQKRLLELEEERLNAKVAREIHRLRQEHQLTQAQLAKRVGTTPSVISRLEDADYQGHSLSMLRRIASSLDQQVEIRFIPVKHKLQAA
ncbi:XRE family transcriptional regulator [Kamptonema cortianum]|uniref:XRE family transcriptional regulator n=1 Tax=Geitlerinema calcuttense NRMC-F 0142 TaxID=2922238 RepID=A0ABT7LY15_9CYAN|nr:MULTISPECIES: XRE family transcriptional regulator [Cyanophyceae]MDK3157483.1 XRE family transcriptional regulator [Kamptonema cortianum]MDL5052598.1 XRE family transcriptional regulator [Oscillatoria laete-virens NRMC-F 0139]MDL5056901.1 XRE family transcriptional regulator [Geitlerinema calcuttense NRMC-F 0142]